MLKKMLLFWGFAMPLLCFSEPDQEKNDILMSHPEIRRITERGRLIVALTKDDHPPFFMIGRNGRLCGVDVELARTIAKELGVDVEFNRQSESFDMVVSTLASGKADIAISKLSCTLERAKRVLYTTPYAVLHKGLLVNRLELARKRGSRGMSEFIRHLSGNLGFLAGTSYEKFAEKMFPNAKLIPFSDWQSTLDALRKGELLAVFRDELELKRVLRADPDDSITLQCVIFKDTEDPIAIAVASDSPHLRDWLNLFLATRKIHWTVDTLLDKYPEVRTQNAK